MADTSITREEKYLEYLTGNHKGNVPKPVTRRERYLYELCLKGMGGEISPEEIKNAVDEYLEKNPVKPGATTEQAAQIEQNKKDVASLKEDISTKITKFYASNQGETHLADSDNGKIMDMMVYGKSEQKQYSGKNLLNATLQTTTQNGVTCTNNGDGTYTLSGTATADALFSINLEKSTIKNGMRVVGCPENGSDKTYHAYIYDSVTYAFYDYGNGGTIRRTDESSNISYNIRVRSGITVNNLLFKPMIVDASLYPDATYDDFEPYTGGIPSPNPDYPQEIKSVVNPTVKVCGKNLYTYHDSISNFAGIKIIRDGSNITLDGTANANGPEDTNKVLKNVFLKKGTYTLSYNIESGSKTLVGDNLFRISLNSPLIEASIQVFIVGTNNAVTFTLNKDAYASVICKVNSGSVYSNCKFNIQIEVGSTQTAYEPYHEQTVTLPYTLNAIPVSSGGNVTIDGQEYVSDYFDVERGKLVRMCKEIEKVTSDLLKALSFSSSNESVKYAICNGTLEIKEAYDAANVCYALCSHFKPIGWYSGDSGTIGVNIVNGEMRFYFGKNPLITTLESAKQFFEDNEVYISGVLKVPKEIDLTDEEVQALKALATYYPTTSISVNSEQLDGYTVFNYPISMENGWNYVKQQIGDTRDYIYDMDARTQDTDLQAAEAYVNSEYAVALTELEV